MPADFVTMCDAIAAELQATVSGVSAANAVLHRYNPWDPKALDVGDGQRHMAIWPVGEAEVADPLATGSHQFTQPYVVLVWEPAVTDVARGVTDEAATKTFLQLHNDVRARFYVDANQHLGGSELTWYAGSQLPDEPSDARWFAITVSVRRFQAFA